MLAGQESLAESAISREFLMLAPDVDPLGTNVVLQFFELPTSLMQSKYCVSKSRSITSFDDAPRTPSLKSCSEERDYTIGRGWGGFGREDSMSDRFQTKSNIHTTIDVRSPSTIALRCFATPTPLKYLASASASADLTWRLWFGSWTKKMSLR